jgi:predicted RND superfamily exporter protein
MTTSTPKSNSFDTLSCCSWAYDHLILRWPWWVIICLLLAVGFLGYHAKGFTLDASSETLLLENDQDLLYWRDVTKRYKSQDFAVVTYTPLTDTLLSDPVLNRLGSLKDDLQKLERVSGVLSILDVPFLESPPVPVKELADGLPTLESPRVDRVLAEIELKNSPLYSNLLVSSDLKTTALIVNFKYDEVFQNLLSRRDTLRDMQVKSPLTQAQSTELTHVTAEMQKHWDTLRQQNTEDIATIRTIMDKYRQDADLFLGGVAMITTDLIGFIKSDLKVFGLGILFFLVATLAVIFKRLRWILLPMACCVLSAIAMIGMLGLFSWKVTVISSNFISLQLIITMAITIHLTVRYRGLRNDAPDADHRQLVLDTMVSMFLPCLYVGLSTIAGFGSLLLCNIKPVINFGWMMSAGIIVSLVITFLFFPTALLLIGKGPHETIRDPRFAVTVFLSRFTEARGRLILVAGVIIFVGSMIGISRLIVENSFIDYFKESTEIYQGMKTIDQQLGGTTPLDIIVKMPSTVTVESDETNSASPTPTGVDSADDEADDDFGSFEEFDEPQTDARYWFTPDKMDLVVRIHDYLDSLDATGKVLSLGTMIKIARNLNDGKPLDSFQMALLYTELPDSFKEMVLDPYVSIPDDELRFTTRIKDSNKSLRRDALLKKIRHDLINELEIDEKDFHLTGLMVLYNNVLQSLFSSQIATLGVALLALMVMFLILFRSLKVALIAIAPNVLAICFVLGFMGWMKIPLDMMTITIAAISIGIAVDDTIHYIYRFIEEFEVDRQYIPTMHRCHGSIGYAMLYTSITIIVGFSILVLSNFIPSSLFGMLTGLAMFIALISSLTVLPQLIVVFKPFGPEKIRVDS